MLCKYKRRFELFDITCTHVNGKITVLYVAVIIVD